MPRPIICQNFALLITFLKNHRSGGKANQGRIEVVEDVPVFVVDGAVDLIADDQVEMAHGEQLPLPVFHQVDAVYHGLVGGKDAVGGVVVLLLARGCSFVQHSRFFFRNLLASDAPPKSHCIAAAPCSSLTRKSRATHVRF